MEAVIGAIEAHSGIEAALNWAETVLVAQLDRRKAYARVVREKQRTATANGIAAQKKRKLEAACDGVPDDGRELLTHPGHRWEYGRTIEVDRRRVGEGIPSMSSYTSHKAGGQSSSENGLDDRESQSLTR